MILHPFLNILKVHDIHKHAVLQFVYKCKTHSSIPNFNNYFPTRGEFHNLNLRNNDQLNQTHFNRNHGRTTVQHLGSVYWNQLPNELRQIDKSLNVFKNSIFKFFRDQYIDN